MSRFAPRGPADLLRLVEAFPLAWIVSHGPAGFGTAVMPLLPEPGEDGAIAALFGHIPLGHPQVPLLRETPRALILFQGPNAYVSPALVSRPGWAPTWNFTVAAFTVDVEFVPAETDEALRRLVARMEADRPDPWTSARMGPRYAELAARVVAFRAHVRAVEARFKHGQDEDPLVFDEIVRGLADRALAAWMEQSVHG